MTLRQEQWTSAHEQTIDPRPIGPVDELEMGMEQFCDEKGTQCQAMGSCLVRFTIDRDTVPGKTAISVTCGLAGDGSSDDDGCELLTMGQELAETHVGEVFADWE